MTAPRQDVPQSGFDRARTAAHDTLDQARHKAADTAHRTATAIDANPLAVVVGGVALGALAGALLPRSAKEKELLAPLGARLGQTARQAFAAAREAGQEELRSAGLTPGAAKERGRSLFDGVGKALASAGSAAANTARSGSKAEGGTASA